MEVIQGCVGRKCQPQIEEPVCLFYRFKAFLLDLFVSNEVALAFIFFDHRVAHIFQVTAANKRAVIGAMVFALVTIFVQRVPFALVAQLGETKIPAVGYVNFVTL
jgi:hypothetical protein